MLVAFILGDEKRLCPRSYAKLFAGDVIDFGEVGEARLLPDYRGLVTLEAAHGQARHLKRLMVNYGPEKMLDPNELNYI